MSRKRSGRYKPESYGIRVELRDDLTLRFYTANSREERVVPFSSIKDSNDVFRECRNYRSRLYQLGAQVVSQNLNLLAIYKQISEKKNNPNLPFASPFTLTAQQMQAAAQQIKWQQIAVSTDNWYFPSTGFPTFQPNWYGIDVGVELNTPPQLEPQYEVNMVEALVGWKAWKLHLAFGEMVGLATNYAAIWLPEKPMEARCPYTQCPKSPGLEKCCCGIYAADNEKVTSGYGTICGKIYGWGRYVRGDSGWRSEFAYPKEFLLEPEQIKYVDFLKKYHVPIYVKQPMRIYSPSEDGFMEADNANWEDSPDRNR